MYIPTHNIVLSHYTARMNRICVHLISILNNLFSVLKTATEYLQIPNKVLQEYSLAYIWVYLSFLYTFISIFPILPKQKSTLNITSVLKEWPLYLNFCK